MSNIEFEHDAHLIQATNANKDYVEGYDVDRELSNVDRTTWLNKRTGHATVVYRATDPTNMRDLGTDALLAFGLEHKSSRFKHAEEVAQQAKSKYGDNVHLAGHSLGGSLAMNASAKTGLKANVYNPGSSVIVAAKQAFKPKDYSKVTNNVVLGDPISNPSMLYRTINTKVLKGKVDFSKVVDKESAFKAMLTAHSTDNFV